MIYKVINVKSTVIVQGRMICNIWWYKLFAKNRNEMSSTDNRVNVNDSEVAVSVLEGRFYHPHPCQFIGLTCNIIKPMN